MHDFEKLGMFYLGRNYDLEAGEVLEQTLLYEARDLTTHGVCVGMTGSGKTGLCISLLEEELATQQRTLADLERELADAVTDVELDCDPASPGVEEVPVKPRKNDITVKVFGRVWIPWKVGPDGTTQALARL